MTSEFEKEVNSLIESYKKKLKAIEQAASQANKLQLESIFVKWLPLPILNFRNAVEKFRDAEEKLQIQVIDFLHFRDEIQASITHDHSPKLWLPLLELDRQFKSNAELQGWSNQIDRLRQSLNPEVSADCWWWFSSNLVTPVKQHLTCWVKLFIRAVWIAACIIFIHFSSKVIAGNPDAFGLTAVFLNAILSLIIANGILFGVGVIGLIEQIMSNFHIPGKWQQGIQLVVAIFILIVAALLTHHLPFISNYYYDKAEVVYKNSEFCPSIERCLSSRGPSDNPIYRWAIIATKSSNPYTDYYRAIKFDPQNLDAQNRLGEIYEDREELEKALGYYQTAARGESIASIVGLTNVGRYYILKGENDSKSKASYVNAVTFLNESQELIKNPELTQHEVRQLSSEMKTKPFSEFCKAMLNPQRNDRSFQRLKRKCAWFELNRYSYRVHTAWAHFRLGQANSSSSPQQSSNENFYLKEAKEMLTAAIKFSRSFERYLDEDQLSYFATQEPNQPTNRLGITVRNNAKCLLLGYPEDLYQEVQKEAMKVRVESLLKNPDFWIQQLEYPWDDLKKRDVEDCLDTLRNVEKLRSYEAAWWFNAETIERSLKKHR